MDGGSVGAKRAGVVVSILAIVFRLATAAVFLFAAVVKISDPQAFAMSIQSFDFMPDHLVTVSAFVVPWTEAVVGVALVLGVWTRAASLVYLVLLGTFTGLIFVTLQRGLEVTCGCFGKFKLLCEPGVTECNLQQNALLLGVGLVTLILGAGRWSVDDLRRRAGAGGGSDGGHGGV